MDNPTLIWWLSRADVATILGPDSSVRGDRGLDLIPQALQRALARRSIARGNGGVIMGRDDVGRPAVDMGAQWDSPIGEAVSTERILGIPVTEAEAASLAFLPGFVTDLDFQFYRPGPRSLLQDMEAEAERLRIETERARAVREDLAGIAEAEAERVGRSVRGEPIDADPPRESGW